MGAPASTYNEFGANAPSSPRAEVRGATTKGARRWLNSRTWLLLRAVADSLGVVPPAESHCGHPSSLHVLAVTPEVKITSVSPQSLQRIRG